MYGKGTGMMPRPGMGPKAGGGGATTGETPKGTGSTTAPANARHTRTEFVILLVWREPTPSDSLRGGLEGAADAAGGGMDNPMMTMGGGGGMAGK
jgi:hypothetical protein